MQTIYNVPGVSCEHCRTAITGEVAVVDVELGARRVTVSGAGFDDAPVRAAIDLAGYDVA